MPRPRPIRPTTTSPRLCPTLLPLMLAVTGQTVLVPASAHAQTCVLNQLTPLPAPPLISGAGHGTSTALLGDLALVGAPFANGATFFDGIVSVYLREAEPGEEPGTWLLDAILTAPDAGFVDAFGSSVAVLHPDRIAVGAPQHDGFGIDAGAVYVFDRIGGAWSLSAKLGAAAPAGSLLGTALAAQDGTIVATAPVIAPCAGAACDAVAAHVYREVAGEWTLEALLTPQDGAAGRAFGETVALEGDRILIGAPFDDDAANDAGAVYSYERTDTGGGGVEWSAGVKLLPSFTPASTARYGSAVAMLGDEFLIGAPGADLNGTNSGAIQALRVVEGRIDSTQLMIGAAGTETGVAIAFADLDRFVAGRGSTSFAALILLYQRPERSWTRTALLGVPMSRTGEVLGLGASLAAEGETVLAGAPSGSTVRGGSLAGGAFVGSIAPWPDCDGDGVADGCGIVIGLVEDLNDNNVPDACDDCNDNRVPDQEDIGSGTSPDCDGDFEPDECQIAIDPSLDCNRNGLIDSCEILAGVAEDCDGNGVLDACELSATPERDCNGNGILDVCDIAAGLEADCDFDDVPDGCAIAAGFVTDCDGNGIPDFCDAVNFIDDTTAESAWGTPPTPIQFDFLWLNPMTVQGGGEVIVAISIMWLAPNVGAETEALAKGTPATLVLYTDPDADGMPDDAALLAAIPTTIPAGVEPGQFVTIPIPPTDVGAVGERFFAGVFMTALPPDVFPAAADFTGPFEESGWVWLTGAGVIDPNDLAALQEVGSVFMLRTISAPGFALAADLDCDGSVGPGDLGRMLGAWGPCPKDPSGAPTAPLGLCAGDLNGDGVVDGVDLGLLLGVWK